MGNWYTYSRDWDGECYLEYYSLDYLDPGKIVIEQVDNEYSIYLYRPKIVDLSSYLYEQYKWYYYKFSAPTSATPVIGTGVESGEYNGWYHCSSGSFLPSQTVSGLTVGAVYDLSWDLYLHFDWNGTSASGLSFGVFLDGDILDLSEQLTYFWVSDQVSFTALDESLTLMFVAELDNRTPSVGGRTDVSYYIDNISLTQQIDNGPGGGVPEPAGKGARKRCRGKGGKGAAEKVPEGLFFDQLLKR